MGRGSPFDKLRDREGDAGAEHVEAQTRYSLLGQAKRAELERDRLRDRAWELREREGTYKKNGALAGAPGLSKE